MLHSLFQQRKLTHKQFINLLYQPTWFRPSLTTKRFTIKKNKNKNKTPNYTTLQLLALAIEDIMSRL
jgi:hypothetical protein